MTPQQIEKILEENPAFIARSAEIAVDEWILYKEAKEVLITKKAKILLEHKLSYPKTSQYELEAGVDSQTEVERIELVRLEANYKKADIEVTEHDNVFTGAKRIGDLKRELRAIEGQVRE